MLKIVAYPVKQGKSGNGKEYQYQTMEIVQSPARPNCTFRRFVRSQDDALAPGEYVAQVEFYTGKDFVLTPVFSDFKKA